MEEGLIRFEQENQNWKNWQERAQSKFGDDIIKSSQFQKDYLNHLEGLEIKYRSTANKFEQLELNILREKRRAIEKVLYPNWFERKAYRLIKSHEMNKASKVHALDRVVNAEHLNGILKKKGFTGLEEQLAVRIKSNQQEFKIPVTFQVNEKSAMNCELWFSKDGSDQYQLRDVRASLKVQDSKQQQSLLYSSIPGVDLTMKQAYNLLSGRAIEKQQGWVMLDINDKDAEGNLRPKVFNAAYGFSVEKLLEQSGIKGIEDIQFKNELLQKLRDGESLQVQVGKSIRQIEANPTHNSLEHPALVIAKRQEQIQAALKEKSKVEEVTESQTVKMRVG
ncbi:MAG: hypothetical protein LBF27_13925 [Sphingobacterium sp.]|jgi:uncharacterized protein YifE (UPF0438 family)|nr:hypothetical protein [Sphingobacterium sp.]